MSGEKLDGVTDAETPSNLRKQSEPLTKLWVWKSSGSKTAPEVTRLSLWRLIRLITAETSDAFHFRRTLWQSMLQDEPGLAAWILGNHSFAPLERLQREGRWSCIAECFAQTVCRRELANHFLHWQDLGATATLAALSDAPVSNQLLPHDATSQRAEGFASDEDHRHFNSLSTLAQKTLEQPTLQADFTGVPERTESGPILYFLLRQANDRVEDHPGFQRALQQAKLDAMKELAYGASHEINNPLANIASRAQMLHRNEKEPERRRALATIHGQAMRAHEMIADMMFFAKPPELRREWVTVNHLIDRWRQAMVAEIPNSMVCHGADVNGQWQVRVDVSQMLTALQAIGRNAIEAMGDQGVIDCQLTVGDERGPHPSFLSGAKNESSWRWILIRDSGPGMNARTLEHLFDPFFSGREAGRGLGFGLSKAWRIVTAHEGQLLVIPTDQGACLAIGLPEETNEGMAEETASIAPG